MSDPSESLSIGAQIVIGLIVTYIAFLVGGFIFKAVIVYMGLHLIGMAFH